MDELSEEERHSTMLDRDCFQPGGFQRMKWSVFYLSIRKLTGTFRQGKEGRTVLKLGKLELTREK